MAEVLCSVPKHKKAMMHLSEKMYVLGKICSGVNYSIIDHEFNVNKWILHRWNVFKQKLIKQGYVYISWQKCCDQGFVGT